VDFRDAELSARRPVWEALSDLFLDTDTSLAREWRVRVLASSPYSIQELERILIDEVYPVCLPNLLSIAGEWAGFDSAWLEDRILKNLHKGRRIGISLIGRLTVPRMSEWKQTKKGIEHARI
jgi:hypothetical protein